jgi:tetratricopeptide (TPR) repeat protein
LQLYVQRRIYTYQAAQLSDGLVRKVQGSASQLAEPEAMAWLGDMLAHLDRQDEAAAMLTRAIAASPDLALAHASLGLLRARQGKSDQALEHLQRAAALKSNNELAYFYYAAALVEQRAGFGANNDFNDAMTALARALELRPGFVEALSLLGYVQLLAGRDTSARDSLQRAVQQDPSNARTALLLARAHINLGAVDAARDVLGPLIAHATDAAVKEDARTLLTTTVGLQRQQDLRRQAGLAGSRETASAPESAKQPIASASSANEAASTAPPDRTRNMFRPDFRPRGAGEERSYGVLERIECSAAGLVFRLRTLDSVLELNAARFDNVQFITYRQNAPPAAISCGPLTPPEEVYLTWRMDAESAGGAQVKIAVAVELLPEGFVPEIR